VELETAAQVRRDVEACQQQMREQYEESKHTCWTSSVCSGPWLKRQYDHTLQKWGYHEAEQALYNLRQALRQFETDPRPDRPDAVYAHGV